MRRALRGLGLGLCLLLFVGAAGAGYLCTAYPNVGEAPHTRIEASEEKRARGAYLAEHVTICVDCHSARDPGRFSGPVLPGTLGQGGERFGHELGLPGELVAPNITPFALSRWSDGEIVRAITSGVTPDGRALFPLMNYPAYASLCREDLDALVVYLRSLAPVAHRPAETKLDFPVSLIVRTLPRPAPAPVACPERRDSVDQGRYLVGVAGCSDCHTPRKGADPIAELAFSGGSEMPLATGGKVRVKNITPDVESGIGSWSREAFIARFAAYRRPESAHAIAQGDFNTPMPWTMYAGMSDEDLGAIYDYLRTIPKVRTDAARVASR